MLSATALGQPTQPSAAVQLDSFRARAAQIRLLAENDAPRAYEEAKRLQATLPPTAGPVDRARMLNLLARIETYLALTEQAATHAQEAFDIAVASGDRVGQAESDLNVALNAVNRGDINASSVATQHSVTILEGVDRPDLLGEAMLRTTAMYRRFDQLDDSVAVAVRAMQFAQRSNNPLVLAYAHNALAIVYDLSGRLTESREHALQMQAQAQAAHSRLLEGMAVSHLAALSNRMGDARTAMQLTREAVAIFREVGAPFATSYGLFALADLAARSGKHRAALRYVDEILEIYQRYPNRISEWYAWNARSSSYQGLGDISRADADAERAYQLAKSLGFPYYLSGSATRRAAIASAKGNFRRAYELTLEANDMTARYAQEKAGARVLELIKRYEAEAKHRDFEALSRRSEQQAAQLTQRELQQRWLWTLLGGVFLALVGLAVFLFRVHALNADLEVRVRQRTEEFRKQAVYLQTLIDERKAVEVAREAALSEAQHLARQRSVFLAHMSHELRTPLNAITGFAQLLQRDKTLSERQARGLRIIDESGRHLLTLINDLLDLARIDAARIELYPTEVNLSAFMEIVCDTIRLKAVDKGLLFTFEAASDLPGSISVDERRLRQILLNLLSNAVKFTDAGRITLRLLRADIPAQTQAEPASAHLCFEVEDQGIGMTDVQMGRLFQPFEQVHEGRRREGGTGLGLAITRQLIHFMGGDIQVRSRLGHGSVFSFSIKVPVVRDEVRAPPVHRTPTGYRGERRRILVVDDVMPNRAMLVEVLASLGFMVDEALDGEKALESVERLWPDLIIIDLMMPAMDGFEATRRLRAQSATREIPIIATSASATREIEARSRDVGADAFVSKPVQESVLLRIVAELLHLEWTFEESAPPQVRAALEAEVVVPPPPDELEVLRELALAGNMRSIRDRADHVRSLDGRYAAFAEQLRTLAEGYQSSAITDLIERYSHG